MVTFCKIDRSRGVYNGIRVGTVFYYACVCCRIWEEKKYIKTFLDRLETARWDMQTWLQNVLLIFQTSKRVKNIPTLLQTTQNQFIGNSECWLLSVKTFILILTWLLLVNQESWKTLYTLKFSNTNVVVE